ncbi:MAG: hypothetical protein WBH44_02475 [Proteocatella sp.]
MSRILEYFIKAGESKKEGLVERWVEKTAIYSWEDVISDNRKKNKIDRSGRTRM